MDPAVGRPEWWCREKFQSVWSGVLILLAHGRTTTGDHTGVADRRLWRLLQPHQAMLAQAFVGAAGFDGSGVGTSVFVQKIVD